MYNKRMWDDKRYHSLNYYLKENYNYKLYKLALNAGMTCPNRDGKLSTKGCIFCSLGGSGDFAASKHLSITDQIIEAKKLIHNKTNRNKSTTPIKYIAYFQAYTNTYAPIDYLRKVFFEAINSPDIEIISIATRPDCLNTEVLNLLSELNKIKPVWVELGLQTIHESTAKFINRGYTLDVFNEAITNLNKIGITIIVHLILGLPYESEQHILETINYISKTNIHGLKLQLLHILKNTPLANIVDQINILSLDEYTDLIIKCIERLPQKFVLHRLTGDGKKEDLIAPLWSTNKLMVMNTINHKMKELNTWQGKYCDY